MHSHFCSFGFCVLSHRQTALRRSPGIGQLEYFIRTYVSTIDLELARNVQPILTVDYTSEYRARCCPQPRASTRLALVSLDKRSPQPAVERECHDMFFFFLILSLYLINSIFYN